jgi:hypothetical protein
LIASEGIVMLEPELITIVEGPTPDFRPSPQLWFQSILEGPVDSDIAVCELRTLKGESIVERCRRAWREGRPVKLDFPDQIRMRQQVDVVAMRLQEVDEGKKLVVWVRQPAAGDEDEQDEEEGADDGEDGIGF